MPRDGAPFAHPHDTPVSAGLRFAAEIIAWVAGPWAATAAAGWVAAPVAIVLVGLPAVFSTASDKKQVSSPPSSSGQPFSPACGGYDGSSKAPRSHEIIETFRGAMAEWTKAAVLKTARRTAPRGFESHSLRHFHRAGGPAPAVQTAPLPCLASRLRHRYASGRGDGAARR